MGDCYDSYDAAGKGESSKLGVKLIDAAGAGFPVGVIWESSKSLLNGIRMVPKGSKDRLINCLREAWGLAHTYVAFTGGRLAAYFTVYEAIECGVAYIRQKDDMINTPVAGALCGCMLGIRRGFRHAARNGLRDGAFFTAAGLASFVYGRRFISLTDDDENEKNVSVKPMVIPALAVVQQTSRSTLIPIPRMTDESVQLHKLSNTKQGFGGLYTSPKLRPYLSSGIKMDSSANDKEI